MTFAQLQVAAVSRAGQVADSLGTSSGGFYLESGKPVINVTDDAALRKVETAGITAKKVKHTFAALTDVKNQLDGVMNVPQTAWGIDTKTDQVVVSIYDASGKTVGEKVTAAAAKYGDSVRIEHRPGRLEPHIRGGDAIHSSAGVTCSLGFNVKRDGIPFLLTAGHCTHVGGTWYGADVTGARVVASNSPTADSGLLTRPNGTGPSQVNTGQQITSAASPVVGEQIASQGKTTGTRSGKVFAVDQTVNFDFGVVKHEFGATIATEAGDSGGPAYDSAKGLGTLTGGDDQVSFYYPLTLELQLYGLQLA